MKPPRDRGPLARIENEQPSGPRSEGSPQDTGPWSSRGYLPHFDVADIWQAITYRLADSMPRHVIEQMETVLAKRPDDGRAAERRKRIEAWINAGHGSCILCRDAVAALILETWQRFAGERYDLGPWVIMPNHVHVLIRVNPGWPLSRIVASWKSYTSKRIMAMTGLPAPIWWPDYWDRFIRSDEHWIGTKHYIERNPVAAGLVRDAADWRWSSASRDRSTDHSWDRGPLARMDGERPSGPRSQGDSVTMGGLAKARRLFGAKLATLLDDLKRSLVA